MVEMAADRDNTQHRSLELFTGAGGLALGTHFAGFDHVALVELNPNACATLRHNIERNALSGISAWQVHEEDVTGMAFTDLGNVDFVFGGPPCQPFSVGGKHRGVHDERNMIPEFTRAVVELTPQAFIMENVKGLKRQRFATYFEYIRLSLAYPSVRRRMSEDWLEHLCRLERIESEGRFRDLHYNVVSRVVNAADYGVPQARERVFIVGFRSDLGVAWNFPEATHSKQALLCIQNSGEYWDRRRIRPPRDWKYSRELQHRLADLEEAALKPWVTVRDALRGLPDPAGAKRTHHSNHAFYPGARSYPGHTGSVLDQPAKTLKAGDHGVPGGENMIVLDDGTVRYLTVREAARVQTFPDSWQFRGTWIQAMRQLGNAVPVKLAHALSESALRAIASVTHTRSG